MFDSRIVRIQWGSLPGRRPRHGGGNARLLEHGQDTSLLLMRLETEDGHAGFGWSQCLPERAGALLGQKLQDVFAQGEGPSARWRDMEYPLWDLAARMSGQPVYGLLLAWEGRTAELPVQAPCYDTTLLIDDLHLDRDGEAVALLQEEARCGYDRGHRAFKIKVGRGARHMPLAAGTARDIAVIHGVREAVGPACALMIDANNGYNLNLAKQVLAATAADDVYWLEEAFHEDPVLYAELQNWIAAEGLSVRIADGEGGASPSLLDWAQAKLIDVVQYDIFAYGFTRWRQTGRQLDAWATMTAPHHYGRVMGNYVTGHLAPVLRHFGFVEWDESDTPGLHSAYRIQEGRVQVPETPGFGLELDGDLFAQRVEAEGYACALR